MELPIVLSNDNGIRPAGKPDACFYCGQKVGNSHRADCIILERKIRIRYIFDIEILNPHSWDKNMIEFRRNMSGWCASNAIDDIKTFEKQIEKYNSCLCRYFKAEVLEIIDMPPIRKNNKGEIIK